MIDELHSRFRDNKTKIIPESKLVNRIERLDLKKKKNEKVLRECKQITVEVD